MTAATWTLRRGAVWKAAGQASAVFLPAARATIHLDAAATRQLEALACAARAADLPPALAGLVDQGILTQHSAEGQPLVLNRAEPRLDYVVLRITNACNLRCRHCFVASGKPDPSELSLGEIQQLFAALEVFGPLVVVLTGGEPLLRRDVFDIADLAAQHNMAVDISTNGTLVRRSKLERLAALRNLRYVILSLEGPSAQVHDAIRGAGNFDQTIGLARRLVERGVAVSINHCVTAVNLPYLAQTIDLAVALGAQSVHLAAVSESGRARDHWSELALTPEQRMQVSLVGVQKYLETGGKVLAGEAEREVAGVGEAANTAHNCGVGRDWCMIYADGDVAPCRPVYAAVGAAGNIRRQSFDDIWLHSSLLNHLRAIRDDAIPRCRLCAWRPSCHGGCRARAYLQTGDWSAPESVDHCRNHAAMILKVNRVLDQVVASSVQTEPAARTAASTERRPLPTMQFASNGQSGENQRAATWLRDSMPATSGSLDRQVFGCGPE